MTDLIENPETPKSHDQIWAEGSVREMLAMSYLNIHLVERGVYPNYIQDMDHEEFSLYCSVVQKIKAKFK